MHAFTKYLVTGVLVAGVGCTIHATTTTDHATPDGTTEVAPTQATAVVTGYVDASVRGNLRFSINESPRAVELAPDDSFVVPGVPSGDVTFTCDTDDVRGTLTISNVQPGERIEVTIKREGDAIVIVIVRRTPAAEPPRQVTGTSGSPLEIDASDVCYYMKPGVYGRDVIIKGSGVTLIGASHQSCAIDDITALTGTLTITGDDVRVFDVDVRGRLVITGHDDHVQNTCNHCYDHGCGHCDDGSCGHCGDDDHHACSAGDAGAAPTPGEDAGEDAGATLDASAPDATPTEDAAPPMDAGPATDAAPIDAGPADAPNG